MSDMLYEAHPSIWRQYPFATLFTLAVVGVGAYIASTGEIPYLAPLYAGVALPEWADPRYLRYLGYALMGLGLLRLFVWWVGARFEHLAIRENEVVYTRGLLNKEYTETNMSSIRTVRVTQSLLQRLLGAGDIVIFTTGDLPEISVKGLPRPREIREHIKSREGQEA